MKKIYVICPRPSDATSFWRGVGPYSALKTARYDIDYHYSDQLDWNHCATHDIYFFQRPFNSIHRITCEFIKSLNRKLVVDWDDDLTRVPPYNPTHHIYNRPNTVENIKVIMELADHITVSTDWLKKELSCYGNENKISVIRNAWNDISMPLINKPWKNHKRIFWRGSQTHDEDMAKFLNDFEHVLSYSRDHEFLFIGRPYWKVAETLDKKRTQVVQSNGLIHYYNILKVLESKVCLNPLIDTSFNRSKSNIAWQEATYAGAACIAPDFDEWMENGIINFDSKKSNLYETYQLNQDNLKKKYEESLETMHSKFVLSKVNKQRFEILEGL